MSQDLFFYGSKLDSLRMKRTLEHLFETNLRRQEAGMPGTPICIWGTHGIGKTMLVEQYAEEQGWGFSYCAPAQFEEMGDLNGLPVKDEVDGKTVTRFAPPSWVPKGEGPGILLLDDVNRADDRILRGIMQLLQRSELFAWSLPTQWQIVCTANPEGGDYSVTPMDDAMLTRLLHVTMVFDVKAWARWADRTGVDKRGISFVLTYPEVVTGRRTTPRSLTQFFGQIAHIDDLKNHLDLVQTLAMSSLDQVTVTTFLSFVNDNLQELIEPEEILETERFSPISKRLKGLAEDEEGGKRVDRLATICTRLFLHLTREDYEVGEAHPDNLIGFLTHDSLPNDLRMSLHKDLLKEGSKELKKVLRHKKLADLMLAGM